MAYMWNLMDHKIDTHLFYQCVLFATIDKRLWLFVFSENLPYHMRLILKFFLLFIYIRMGGDEKDRHPASRTTSICHITLPWQQDAMMWYESLNTLMLLFGVVQQCLSSYLFIWWREAYLSTRFALSVQDFKRWY